MVNMDPNSSFISYKLCQIAALTRFSVASIHSDLLQNLLTIVSAFRSMYMSTRSIFTVKAITNVNCFLLTLLSRHFSTLLSILLNNFQVFPANKDRNTVAEHLLVTAFNARLIRFQPKTYHGHTSMRVEVYGCRNGMCLNPINMYCVSSKKKTGRLLRLLRPCIFQNTLRVIHTLLNYFIYPRMSE